MEIAAPGMDCEIAPAPLDSFHRTADSQIAAKRPIMRYQLVPEAPHPAPMPGQACTAYGDAERRVNQWRVVNRAVYRVLDEHGQQANQRLIVPQIECP